MNLKLISTAMISTNPTRRYFNYFRLDAVWISGSPDDSAAIATLTILTEPPFFFSVSLPFPSLPPSILYFAGPTVLLVDGNFTVYIEISAVDETGCPRKWMTERIPGFYYPFPLSSSLPYSSSSQLGLDLFSGDSLSAGEGNSGPRRGRSSFPGSGIKRKHRDSFCSPTRIDARIRN